MAHVAFGPGTLYDYYNGGVARTTFMGFPIADRNDFTSGIYESPAIAATLLDIVNFFWRVKTWTGQFSELTVGDTREFADSASTETDIVVPGAHDWGTGVHHFGFGIVINADGEYAIQSDIHYSGTDSTIEPGNFKLTTVTSGSLVFTNPDNAATCTVEPSEYWPYAD